MAKAKTKKKVRGARRPVRDLAAKGAARVKGGKLNEATSKGTHIPEVVIE